MTKSSHIAGRIAILTSGGDAPGMNACIRAIVMTATHLDIEVIGYHHGFNGLLNQEFSTLTTDAVQHNIALGGTILKSARCLHFPEERNMRLAAAHLTQNRIDALLIIGGDGSFRGAMHLSHFWSGKILGIPGTIDNDISGTDATIGYFTAIETALDAIDKIRDTADAFERTFLVEVMGRYSGFIGLNAAIGSGAEHMLLPELTDNQIDLNQLVADIRKHRSADPRRGNIVVMTEHLWPGGAVALAQKLTESQNIDCKPVVLGYIQRGGHPVSQDRILATKLGAFAVECITKNLSLMMVGEQNHQMTTTPLKDSVKQKKQLDPYLLRIQQTLFKCQ